MSQIKSLVLLATSLLILAYYWYHTRLNGGGGANREREETFQTEKAKRQATNQPKQPTKQPTNQASKLTTATFITVLDYCELLPVSQTRWLFSGLRVVSRGVCFARGASSLDIHTSAAATIHPQINNIQALQSKNTIAQLWHTYSIYSKCELTRLTLLPPAIALSNSRAAVHDAMLTMDSHAEWLRRIYTRSNYY